ncbi:WapI family immunity protein [Paraburkholderia bannensis]|uniref:WapI family immunity protein n=1 Tax=Paraburkholderia bannensis TaxID=765414 RepID=UPI0012EC9FA1|nr:hypothetical protein [Paraburkholderia bannensis]
MTPTTYQDLACIAMLQFSHRDDLFELSVLDHEEPKAQSYGGTHLRISVSSCGFRGSCSAWVYAEDMQKFFESLVELQNTSKAVAKLESTSPKEIELSVSAANSRGYLCVSGAIGKHVFTENGNHWHSVSFGIEFESAQLDIAISSLKPFFGLAAPDCSPN